MSIKLIFRGLKNPIGAVKYIIKNLKIVIFSRVKFGHNIFQDNWDVLIILDACRVDALEYVQSEYEFLDNITSVTSLGSHSAEFMLQTFSQKNKDIINQVGLISANPFSKVIFEYNLNASESSVDTSLRTAERLKKFGSWDTVSKDDFAFIDYAWEYMGLGNNNSLIKSSEISASDVPEYITPPETVTNLAINKSLTTDCNRLILHYWQPHTPYLHSAIVESRGLSEIEKRPRMSIKEQKADFDAVYDLYLDELRWALDNISTLLKSIDADKVVITADHGEAFGEFGTYGHPIFSWVPQVKKVPRVETRAKKANHRSHDMPPKNDNPANPTELLNRLGYL